jgi:hypothetical protein
MGSHFIFDNRRADGDLVLSWEFLEGPDRRFFWRAVAADGTISHQSCQTFRSLEECVADASRIWIQAPGERA